MRNLLFLTPTSLLGLSHKCFAIAIRSKKKDPVPCGAAPPGTSRSGGGCPKAWIEYFEGQRLEVSGYIPRVTPRPPSRYWVQFLGPPQVSLREVLGPPEPNDLYPTPFYPKYKVWSKVNFLVEDPSTSHIFDSNWVMAQLFLVRGV